MDHQQYSRLDRLHIRALTRNRRAALMASDATEIRLRLTVTDEDRGCMGMVESAIDWRNHRAPSRFNVTEAAP